MSAIVDFVGSLTQAGWKFLYVLGLIALGVYIVDRGRKKAAIEQAEEARERHAA